MIAWLQFAVRMATLVALAMPCLAEAQQDRPRETEEFLRAAAQHFGMSFSEVDVLSRWGLSADEMPVVLYLANRSGVSPDVLVAQRRRGREWMDIALGHEVHAGDLYVPLQGPAGFLAAAYERFDGVASSAWAGIRLTDQEVVGLVNLRFISVFLGVPPAQVVGELRRGTDAAAALQRLRSGRDR